MRRQKAAQQEEERRVEEEKIAARRSGLRKTAASEAMALAHGDAAAVQERVSSTTTVADTEEARRAVAAKKRASRLRSLENSIAEKQAEREALLQEQAVEAGGVGLPHARSTQDLRALLASERHRGRAVAEESGLLEAVGENDPGCLSPAQTSSTQACAFSSLNLLYCVWQGARMQRMRGGLSARDWRPITKN